MVSFSGASAEHLVPEDNPFRPYQDAKIAADEHLRGTELDWTILGPGALTTDPADGARQPRRQLQATATSPSRELVAQVARRGARRRPRSRKTLVFGDGDVPIDDWLASL